MKLRRVILVIFVVSFLAVMVLSAWSGEPINVNTAGPLELERLYRVNPRVARQIISEREKNGPYQSLEDLAVRIREIGPKTIARWEGLAAALP